MVWSDLEDMIVIRVHLGATNTLTKVENADW